MENIARTKRFLPQALLLTTELSLEASYNHIQRDVDPYSNKNIMKPYK